MKGPTQTAIFLRREAYDAFMGEMSLLTLEAQSRQLGTPGMNLRRVYRGGYVGDRTLIGILRGTAAIARQRGTQPPTFEDLFVIRDVSQSGTGATAGLAA